jgi:hypothetical protein
MEELHLDVERVADRATFALGLLAPGFLPAGVGPPVCPLRAERSRLLQPTQCHSLEGP